MKKELINRRNLLKAITLLLIAGFAIPMFYSFALHGPDLPSALLFFIISTLFLLFCREIKQSIQRAQVSEMLLREERNSLEIKIEERTKEIRALEAEKINQLYRFAEFGRLSSGIFHDLINPLTAVSLNLKQIKTEGDPKIMDAKSYLDQALMATSKMEGLIACLKKRMACESIVRIFSLNLEIEQIIEMLCYKACHAQVDLKFDASEKIRLKGDPVKFGQIITNLLVNAIEACEETEIKNVKIKLRQKENIIIIVVSDTGSGVVPENLSKIFLPFFSTKVKIGRGFGIGLATTKNIIEKDFKGQIIVDSNPQTGTIFTVIIPSG